MDNKTWYEVAINDLFVGVCNEDIWDSNLTWNTNEPNFNRCLRHTILTWIPCAFLILFAFFEVLSVKSLKSKDSSWRVLNTSRLFITITAIIANFAELVFYADKYLNLDEYPYVLFASSALKVITFVIATVLLLFQKSKGLPSIAALWIFIVIHIICFIPTISQLCLHEDKLVNFEYYFNIFYFCLLLVLFILYSFADLPSKSNSSVKPGKTNTGNEIKRSLCPESFASFPSLLFFWWFTGLTYLGYKKPLLTDDIFDLNEEDKSEVIVPVFEKNWQLSATCTRTASTNAEVRRGINRSIIKAILKTFWYDLTIATLLLFVSTASNLLTPVLLQSVLRFMSSNDPTWHGIVIVIAMFTVKITAEFLSNFYYLRISKLQVKMQSCITSVIYKKSLRISSTAKKSSTSGEVVTLIAVDSQRLLDVAQHFLYVFITPIVIVVTLLLLYNQLGYAAFGGLLVLIVMIPIVYLSSSLSRKHHSQQMKLKDERLKYLNETLNGMKVLKLYAWEPSFIKLITDIRRKEMNAYKRAFYLYAILTFQWSFAPFLIGFVSFAIYSFADSSHVLNAEKIFVTLNLMQILNFPLWLLPQQIASSVMAFVAAKRIDKYLNAAELEDYVTRDDSDVAVEVENGHFRWESPECESNNENKESNNSNSRNDVLVDINLNVRLGSLHAIVGQVGSGKSSLLSAILGEMKKVKGSVNIRRKLKTAYVAQQAWIENLTLRENILFGKEYNKEKFDEIINACALSPDLEILPAADLTEIGEKGINLSGGQKQRVSIARSCYSDADLYIFDDPLSAVDAHVANHLFNHLLSSKGLLKDKTRILVTNRLDILSKVDFITVLKDGKISEQGTYEDLMEKKNDFAVFVNQFSGCNAMKNERQMSTLSAVSITSDGKKEECNADTLVEEETAEFGRVKFSVYNQYLKMVSLAWSTIIVTAVGGFHLSQVAGNVWLSNWSNDNVTHVKQDTSARNYRFEIYALIGLTQIILDCFASYSFIKAGLQAAIKTHSNLLNRIFRAPTSFFETTPLGRILNRFSKDMDSVDAQIPWHIKDVMDRLFQSLLAIGVIAAQTGVYTFIILPLIISLYFIQRIYIPTSRQLSRLNSVTRSPIFAHFTQTLQGVSTIRAFNQTNRFIKESGKRVELNLICFYALNAASGWLNVFLNLFGSLVVLFVGFYATFQRDSLTAGMVGLSLSYSLVITETLNWLVKSVIIAETNIVAVERINEYCENQVEAEWEDESSKPLISWPQKGVIEFHNYATRYRPGLDLVLSDVSFATLENEKIGIVGRTGAGKSTITLSLFRILESLKGRIVIDGLDIANLGLHDLRSKLTIIPQDPFLFSGTVRFNLDPFEVYSDDQIWKALQHSHLQQFVAGLHKGLSHEITEGGENLSVGQRQLMCLARAVLRKSKILVLDEATAAVDLETDSLIQTTIKNEFANCTTLTIAHRIQTVLDCDRVMVIERGTVVEFDSPSTLLSDTNSVFHSLAKNAGIIS